ncbi:hypothetical protein CFC21_036378 [Triticum aestivum]|uniref:RING-type domain-containing protein n=2 Tax=Triticum aestivum TaxID=4565 RepID=A0A9R1F8Z7_WHEAT|nr:hypothetical protein CFC21_036378 [Triticum aestivum]
MEPCQPVLEEPCTATVAEVLKLVEAPSDDQGCPICFGQEGGTIAWKETVCGHIFHGRGVEKWLEMKGSCPMCRRQLLAPHTDAKQDPRRVDPFISYVASFMASIPDMHSSDSFNYFRQYL